MRWSWMVLVIGLGGCDELLDDGGTTPETGDTGAAVSDTGTPTTTTTDPGTPWRVTAHPCVGNRTDALLVDGDGALWVGCGSTTSGHGLFRSTDGGVAWSEIDTGPLPRFRVSSLQLSGGLVYVGGIHSDGAERVVSVDPDTLAVSTVFESTSQLWNSFHVGTYRRTPDGVQVAESLTGTDAAWRADDQSPWSDAYPWWPGAESFQLLDLEVHAGEFYGCGSTIGQPPTVFLPDGSDPATGFTLQPLQLATFQGELWDLVADRDGVVAVGVDQQQNRGVIFVSGPDPAEPSGWRQVDVADLIPSTPTWVRGACRDGDQIVAVGEKSMLADGIVLESVDGGATWTEITPWGVGSVPPLHECAVLDDGALLVTGADGFVGRRQP